jgi:hypothetical protein
VSISRADKIVSEAGSYSVSRVEVLVHMFFGLNSIIITFQKRKESESDARTLTVTKKRHSRTVTHYGSERKLQTMRKERTTLSHITPIVLLQKFDMNVSQATRTPEGTADCAYPN